MLGLSERKEGYHCGWTRESGEIKLQSWDGTANSRALWSLVKTSSCNLCERETSGRLTSKNHFNLCLVWSPRNPDFHAAHQHPVDSVYCFSLSYCPVSQDAQESWTGARYLNMKYMTSCLMGEGEEERKGGRRGREERKMRAVSWYRASI